MSDDYLRIYIYIYIYGGAYFISVYIYLFIQYTTRTGNIYVYPDKAKLFLRIEHSGIQQCKM